MEIFKMPKQQEKKEAEKPASDSAATKASRRGVFGVAGMIVTGIKDKLGSKNEANKNNPGKK